MASVNTQNSIVYWSTSTAFSTAQSVSQVSNITGPGPSAGVIDITHLASTAKEKLAGIMDAGQLTFDVLYDPADAGQTALRTDLAARTMRKAAVKFPTASSAIVHGDAFCTGFSISAGLDDALKASVTLEFTGALTWTTN